MSRRSLAVRLLMALAAVGLFLVGYQWGNQWQVGNASPPILEGVLISPPLALPDFVLSGTRGPVGRPDLLDQWTLLAWASPASASGQRGVGRMIEIANRLADAALLRGRLRLWLVDHDAVPNLAWDLERLTSDLRVLSGQSADLDDLAAVLGGERPATEGGLPDLFLIDPQARLLALFPAAQAPAAVAADLRALVRWAGPGGERP